MITKSDLPQFERVLNIFDKIEPTNDSQSFRATMLIDVPIFGKCLVSYLLDEKDCCVFSSEEAAFSGGNDNRLLSGYSLLIGESDNKERVILELLDQIQRNIADQFEDIIYNG